MQLNLRKEQVVLLGTVAVLGLLLWQDSSGGGTTSRRSRSRSRSAGEVEFVSHAVPDTRLAQPAADVVDTGEARDLFAPPRDTRPLAPLQVEPPPLPTLWGLRPPAVPSVAPAHYGRYLRADPTPIPVPGLFVLDGGEDDGSEVSGDLGEDGVELIEGEVEALRSLGYVASDARDLLTPEQRAARIESFKAQYDWVRITEGDPLFGRIVNEARYGLPERPEEPLEFVEVFPETGEDRYPGLEPVPFARSRVLDFGFAATTANRLHLRRAELAGQLTASSYAQLLAFGDDCVAHRNEAREALRFAEEAFTRAASFDPQDPAPLLGLARCYEAGFRFEAAYKTYLDLLERFEHRAEVHVGLGQLEARLRLFESAEARLRRAEELERGSYRVQWALGRFLLDRERGAEALQHLESAFRFEPSGPEAIDVRADIRCDLGEAQLFEGLVEQALASFDRALSAVPEHPGALAGRLSALGVGAGGGDPSLRAAAGGAEGFDGRADFELVLARALIELDRGDPAAARDQLELAAQTDPLRAYAAWRALSWLAETRGYPEEALRWIEEAHQADPTDAWTLYQRGRLYAERGDVEGARESLMAALDRELDFTEALAALGELSYLTEAHGEAELFFERALEIDPERQRVHALRGLNLLELGELDQAEAAFEASLALDPNQPAAHGGRAWLSYLRGDAERAITLFAELDDRRRGLAEEDPYRVFAREQLERVNDHIEKEAWTDRFERRQLKNGWDTEEAAGPEVRLEAGQVVVEGVFRQNGITRFYRLLPAPDFVSIEMDVTVGAANNARVGVFLAKERRRGGGQVETQSMVSAAREKEGGLAVLEMDVAQADLPWQDVPDIDGEARWWPAGETVRVRLEKVGEGSESYGRIFVDGVPVRDGISMRRLASSSSELKLGLFVEGQTGLPASVVVDNVEMVYRTHRR